MEAGAVSRFVTRDAQMRIAGSLSSHPALRPAAIRTDAGERAASNGGGRSLIPLSPLRRAAATAHRRGTRTSAVFLAHLIATAQGAPQTRQRRRSRPEDAIAAYTASAAGADARAYTSRITIQL